MTNIFCCTTNHHPASSIHHICLRSHHPSVHHFQRHRHPNALFLSIPLVRIISSSSTLTHPTTHTHAWTNTSRHRACLLLYFVSLFSLLFRLCFFVVVFLSLSPFFRRSLRTPPRSTAQRRGWFQPPSRLQYLEAPRLDAGVASGSHPSLHPSIGLSIGLSYPIHPSAHSTSSYPSYPSICRISILSIHRSHLRLHRHLHLHMPTCFLCSPLFARPEALFLSHPLIDFLRSRPFYDDFFGSCLLLTTTYYFLLHK